MKRKIPAEIRNQHGERLDFTYHAGAAELSTLVVLGPGLTSTKDEPLLVELAELLARTGLHALRFSFAGNGDSEGRFAEATVSKQVEDLGAVLDALRGWHLGYAGHCLGAAVGVLRAGTDKRLNFLVSLAGMAHTAAFVQREFGHVIPNIGFMWERSAHPLSQAFYEDMIRLHSVKTAARRVRVPWLLVHGLRDTVVPPQNSRDLFAIAAEPRQLLEIPKAEHAFSGKHASEVASAVVAWLREMKV